MLPIIYRLTELKQLIITVIKIRMISNKSLCGLPSLDTQDKIHINIMSQKFN